MITFTVTIRLSLNLHLMSSSCLKHVTMLLCNNYKTIIQHSWKHSATILQKSCKNHATILQQSFNIHATIIQQSHINHVTYKQQSRNNHAVIKNHSSSCSFNSSLYLINSGHNSPLRARAFRPTYPQIKVNDHSASC